jgi:hypothetical protein
MPTFRFKCLILLLGFGTSPIGIIIINCYHLYAGIYSYIPETNHVSRVCSVTVILYLQFMLNVMLYPMLNVLYIYISTSRSMCVVPSMAVLCSSLHLVLSQYVA